MIMTAMKAGWKDFNYVNNNKNVNSPRFDSPQWCSYGSREWQFRKIGGELVEIFALGLAVKHNAGILGAQLYCTWSVIFIPLSLDHFWQAGGLPRQSGQCRHRRLNQDKCAKCT